MPDSWNNLGARVDAVDTYSAADINAHSANLRLLKGGVAATAPTVDVETLALERAKSYALTGSEISSVLAGWSLIGCKAQIWKTSEGQLWIAGSIYSTYTGITAGQFKMLGINQLFTYHSWPAYYSVGGYSLNSGADIQFLWDHPASYGALFGSFMLPIVALPAWAT